MRRLSRIVRGWRDRVLPPPRGHHHAPRRATTPPAEPAPAPAPRRGGDLLAPPAELLPPVPAAPRRVVGPWYVAWERVRPRPGSPVPSGDGLDDLRQALAGPIRQLAAARPDIVHPAPAAGRVRELAGAR
ncbi:hypothetical protein FZ103_00370 [Streptomonospora sp. PA3]|uniref:hypothetical protein n=1 Tax=Streptomonospora sp. PA3 TaxID=2607326 RepID=UPI0012DC1AB1|nr:hypothetical protein [Streptomonospora sp. PA3]MUL39648.1 hypothetical protein [Streptomonospora sp. PA3]